jgi:hypothetical protein
LITWMTNRSPRRRAARLHPRIKTPSTQIVASIERDGLKPFAARIEPMVRYLTRLRIHPVPAHHRYRRMFLPRFDCQRASVCFPITRAFSRLSSSEHPKCQSPSNIPAISGL